MLTDVIIEIRRSLKCANIFLKYSSAVHQNNIKIILKSNNITLVNKLDVSVINLNNIIELDLNNLNNLVVSEYNVNFRVSLVNTVIPENTITNSYVGIKKSENNIKVQVEPNILSQYVCSSCQNVLIENFAFNRVLELPSGSVDIGDFFCHDGPNLEKLLKPNENDLLFGLFYILIDSKHLKNIQEKNSLCFCKRCLLYLGEFKDESTTLKLWNEGVCIKKKNELIKLFDSENEYHVTCAILNRILHESNEISNINSYQFSKIIIESTAPNAKTIYLLINVLEKNLEIIKISKPFMKTETQICLKILYKLETDKYQPLFRFWLKDINTHNVTVSYTIFKYITNLLINNSELVPPSYRKHNGFLLSYFFNTQ